jgi:phage terminase large subunit-like protein
MEVISEALPLSSMTRSDKIELVALLEERERRSKRRKIWTYFPDTGPLRRDLYPIHMQFFANGKTHRKSAAIAANRVGKTETMGCYELACHLTGEYPEWWPGRKFDRAIYAWAAGDTAKTVRDIIQAKLIGEWDDQGTGVILGERLLNVSPKSGVPQAAEIITVRHVDGGVSRLVLKSYDQRREAFQGTEVDVILLDEEPPQDVYLECLIRTMTNDGMILATFTPLMGRTELVKSLLDEAEDPTSGTAVVTVSWDDVPHLTQAAKDELWKALPPFQRDARSKGIPQLGAGAIYQVSEEDLLVDPFKIPDHWPRAYGMDVGWNRTACIWGALDRDTGVLYLYHEHYMGQSPPSENARGIRAPGEWIPGVIDPAANGRSQRDGEQLIQDYRDLGLNLIEADNSVEAGIYRVWGRMVSGRLKVFRTLGNWLKEYRVYQRDENGRVVKKNDHAMDATRYLEVSGVDLAIVKPIHEPEDAFEARMSRAGWMG